MAPFQLTTTTCAAAVSSRATRPSTAGWSRTIPAGLFAAMGGRRRRRAARPLPAQAQRRPRGHPHRPRAARQRANPARALALRLGRRPYRTQAAVRRALRLYSTAPDGYPGNDDLGTLSSWYVFGALGLYPEVPGVGLLAIGSPLFERATIAMPHHRRVTISAGAVPSSATGNAAPGRPQPRRGPLYSEPANQRPCLRGPGRHTVRSPAALTSPSSSARVPTAGGAAPPPPPLPRLAPATRCRNTPARLDTHANPRRRPLGAGLPDSAGRRGPLRQPRRAELPPRRGDHALPASSPAASPTCWSR